MKKITLFYHLYAKLDENAPDCTDKHLEFQTFWKPLDCACICSASFVTTGSLAKLSLLFTNVWLHPCNHKWKTVHIEKSKEVTLLVLFMVEGFVHMTHVTLQIKVHLPIVISKIVIVMSSTNVPASFYGLFCTWSIWKLW